MMLAIFVVSLLAISAVGAADSATADIAAADDMNDDVVSVDENIPDAIDVNGVSATSENGGVDVKEDEVLSSQDNNDSLSAYDDEKLSDTYPPYNAYNVRVEDTSVNYGSGSVVMYIAPSSGYTYTYDFYLKIYDSSNTIKVDKRFYGTDSVSSKSYSTGLLSPGTYTIKIYNNYDLKVMDTAKLTVKSSSSTLPYSAYSLSVSDTTIKDSAGGTISISITPASSYNYKYNFYLKIYDSSNAEKVSQRYYSTTSSNSRTYTISSNKFSVGVYTIKLINYDDSKLMATAKLIVKSSNSLVCPSYSDYTVSVSDTAIDYGSTGYISMRISPATGYNYKYYYYLKVYDSNNNEKISQVYYDTSNANSKTYTVSSNQLISGFYTIKIVNFQDDKVMSTAKLTVKSSVYPSSNDYSVSVSDTTINYGYTNIPIKISPSSKNYKYDFYLKVYDSNNVEKISQRYYSTSSAYSETYTVGSTQLSPGTYTIKILNNFDDNVMSTAKLTVKPLYPSYSDYGVSVSDTVMYYGSGGDILMSISPASTYYKYDYYLKVYDSNGNEMFSQRYYATSSDYSKTYSVGSTQLSQGIYDIKIINYYDNNVMSTAKLNIKKINLETQDHVGKCDGMIQYKVRASENNIYKSGLKITFNCNGNNYEATTDNNGYATLKLHLKAGTYVITTSCNNVVNKNKITINRVYVANKYKDTYVKSLNGYYGSKNKINYGLKGNLEGYFKIYKGNKVVFKTKLNSNGYIQDYFKYDSHSASYSGSAIKNVGTYKAVVTNAKGKVLAKATIKIRKSPTSIKCSSFKMLVGSKKAITLNIVDKLGSKKNINGVAKFKINGKTYKVKVKNGKAKTKKVKFSLKEKTYKCSVKFLGDKNHKASSKKFKISVRKLKSYTGAYAPFAKVGTKAVAYAWVAIKNLNGDTFKAKSGTVKFTIAGKTYKVKVKNGEAKIKFTAPYTAKQYKCNAVYLGSKSVKRSSEKFPLTVKKPASKYKIITTKAKFYKVTKKSGKFKVETCIYDFSVGIRAAYKCIDILLYKNGKQILGEKYSVKYKLNGKWTGWTKHGIYETCHQRHYVKDSVRVDQIKIKVNKKCNSFV